MNTLLRKSIVTIATFSVLVGGCIVAGSRNVEDVKRHAPSVADASGLRIVGYEGYQYGPIAGGDVWYIFQAKGATNTLYHGCFTKWGSEYHLYNFKAINAIGGTL